MECHMQRKDAAPTLETKRLALSVKMDGEDDEFLTITGYGSVFGNADAGGDIVMPGAFKECIASGKRPQMLWSHDQSEPAIGVWDEVAEDANGLRMQGRICKRYGKAAEIAARVKMGAIKGLSIGYRVMPGGYEMEGNNRKLTKLDLWETSVVNFPMNDKATVYDAKSAEDMTQRDLERAFKDMGHSNRMAKAMAGGAWKARADVLRDADATVPEADQRDVDALKALLTETLQKMERK